MNKTYLFGRIVNIPRLVNRPEAPAHLVFLLDVQHKTKQGEVRHEAYPISLWNNKALWGSRALRAGQYITVEGKLTQKHRLGQGTDTDIQNSIEIAADAVILSQNDPAPMPFVKEAEKEAVS